MSILPSRKQDLLDWCALHAPVWAMKPADIGLTPQQAEAFKELSDAARESHSAQLAAEEAARIAANEAREAIARARRCASDLLRSIKGFAATDENAIAIYNKAQIPMAAAPSPAGPPGKPHDFGVTLTPTTGAITLKWKVKNPVGTVGTSYIVKRRVGGTDPSAEFQFVGVTGNKEFTDTTLEWESGAGSEGIGAVQYIVQGQRSRHAGPVSDIVTVNFGKQIARHAESGSAPRGNAMKLAA